MIHETTCDVCGRAGTYDTETGEGTVRPGRANGTALHRNFCEDCAARPAETDEELAARVLDSCRAFGEELAAEYSDLDRAAVEEHARAWGASSAGEIAAVLEAWTLGSLAPWKEAAQ